jgi:hypothetical protein
MISFLFPRRWKILYLSRKLVDLDRILYLYRLSCYTYDSFIVILKEIDGNAG